MRQVESKQSKLCLAVITNSVSGTERIVRDIALSAIEANYKVSALIPEGTLLDRYAGKLRDDSVEIGRLQRVYGVRNPVPNLTTAFNWFQATKPDIVHIHCANYMWGQEVLLGAIMAGVPKVVRTEHNPVITRPRRRHSLQVAMTDPFIDRFTYVSSGNQRRYEAAFPKRHGKGVVVANGTDEKLHHPGSDPEERKGLRQSFGWPERCSVAINVGFYGGRKPLDQLFQAFKSNLECSSRNAAARQWRILIVGEGSEAQRKLPKELGIEEYVVFAGQRDDVPYLLRNSDLYVSTSDFEGLSCAMLEAWASGIPVLSTDVDGIEDVIGTEAYTNQVVPHKDVAAYADAFYEMMVRDEVRMQPQMAGIVNVRTKFTTANMVSGYMNLYNEILVSPMKGAMRQVF